MVDDVVSSKDRKRQLVKAEIDLQSGSLVNRIVLQRSTTIVSFETGNMKVPFESLNTCTRDLLSIWDLDEVAHKAHRPPELAGERVYFTRLHHNFTKAAGNRGHESLLRVRAIIAADGSVSNCHHEYALSSGAIKPDVCDDMREMQFEPATDLDGKPIASVYSRSIVLSRFSPWTADSHGGRWGN